MPAQARHGSNAPSTKGLWLDRGQSCSNTAQVAITQAAALHVQLCGPLEAWPTFLQVAPQASCSAAVTRLFG